MLVLNSHSRNNFCSSYINKIFFVTTKVEKADSIVNIRAIVFLFPPVTTVVDTLANCFSSSCK